ncbi:hypothetical protein GCM10023347_07480 [Streptomyces chumphonensis]
MMMPLARSELVGLVWVRPLKVGEDALAGIAEPANIAAVAGADEGWGSVAPGWKPAPAPQPGGELVPPFQAAVNFSFTPIELDRPDPFGVTVVLMEEDGYRISLTEAFAH